MLEIIFHAIICHKCSRTVYGQGVSCQTYKRPPQVNTPVSVPLTFGREHCRHISNYKYHFYQSWIYNFALSGNKEMRERREGDLAFWTLDIPQVSPVVGKRLSRHISPSSPGLARNNLNSHCSCKCEPYFAPNLLCSGAIGIFNILCWLLLHVFRIPPPTLTCLSCLRAS